MKIDAEIAQLVPYKPGKPISETQREYGLTEVVKLASNENPMGPSERVIQALREVAVELHRYPDSAAFETIQDLAQHFHVPANWVALGNGSNEVIDLLIRLYGAPGDAIYTSDKAFVAYGICAQVQRMAVDASPTTEDLRFDLPEILRRLKASRNRGNKLVFIANPNNPTGTSVTATELNEFLTATSTMENVLVVLDEAYAEYVRDPEYPDGVNLLQKYPHLAVIRTFSKIFGIAGLRLGVLLARPEVIDLFNRIRNPFNVNIFAQVAARTVLKDRDYVARACEINGQGLDYFYKELKGLQLPYWKSECNFVLFDTGMDSGPVFEGLLRQGVILRPVKNYGLHTHLRMSVGLARENEKAIAALKSTLSELGGRS